MDARASIGFKGRRTTTEESTRLSSGGVNGPLGGCEERGAPGARAGEAAGEAVGEAVGEAFGEDAGTVS
eukprot:scaffold3015_cov78-Isochrysis_galbana.AAC.5